MCLYGNICVSGSVKCVCVWICGVIDFVWHVLLLPLQVIYYLRHNQVQEAHDLMRDVEPATPQVKRGCGGGENATTVPHSIITDDHIITSISYVYISRC